MKRLYKANGGKMSKFLGSLLKLSFLLQCHNVACQVVFYFSACKANGFSVFTIFSIAFRGCCQTRRLLYGANYLILLGTIINRVQFFAGFCTLYTLIFHDLQRKLKITIQN